MKAEKAIKFYLEYFLYLFLFLFSSLFVFKVREFFPPPEILASKIVGYSAYNGYPYYFDTYLFFYIILCPVFAYILLFIRKKIWSIL